MALPSSDDQAQNKLVSGIDVMLAVSEASEHKEEAMKFVEFMVNEEVASQYIDEQKAFLPSKAFCKKILPLQISKYSLKMET